MRANLSIFGSDIIITFVKTISLMRSFLILTICTLFSATSFAQKLAIGSFNKIFFEETFNFNSEQFPLSATSDNYIILDDGDLFINRNASSDYSIFAKTPLTLNSYRVKTALKLGPSNNKTAYVGASFKHTIRW